MTDTFRRGVLSRGEIKEIAKMRFTANRWPMVGVVAIVAVISGALSALPLMNLAMIIVTQILSVMTAGYFLDCWRGYSPPFESFFHIVCDNRTR